MTTERKVDRRSQSRFPQHLKISLTLLPDLQAGSSKAETLSGYIHNMSQGGLCVITPRALPPSTLLRCEIAIAEAPIRIGTLVQVRWTERQKLRRSRFLSGLSFLL